MDPAYARRVFGWDDSATIEPGPRGALGRIWRVRTATARYALKEIYSDPPSEAVIAAERAFAAAVRIPAPHRDGEGRFVTPTPDGTWLRLFDWLDLRPHRAAPQDIGILLARLHKDAPRAQTEIDGGPPDPWYDTLRVESDLAEFVAPADPDLMVLCHRDLHPENVYTDASAGLIVVDWDLLGPAMASRELARALFDWYSDPAPDIPAMRALYYAYIEEGGPGRLARPEDFSMLIATRLNFLNRQREIARDPRSDGRNREWAEREIAEGLRIMPTPGQLAAVLAMARADRAEKYAVDDCA